MDSSTENERIASVVDPDHQPAAGDETTKIDGADEDSHAHAHVTNTNNNDTPTIDDNQIDDTSRVLTIDEFLPPPVADETIGRGNNNNSEDGGGKQPASPSSPLLGPATSYESATRKGDAVFELTVVNQDGTETLTPVAKKAPPPPPGDVVVVVAEAGVAAAATNEEGGTTTANLKKPPPSSNNNNNNNRARMEESKVEADEQTATTTKPPTNKRMYFGRDRNIFTAMANAYIKHEIYKNENSNEKWELAISEFYNENPSHTRKPMIAVKRPFLSGLESRIKALPPLPPSSEAAANNSNKRSSRSSTRNNAAAAAAAALLPPPKEETEEQKLCRRIQQLRQEVQDDRIKRGLPPTLNLQGGKASESASGSKKRKRGGGGKNSKAAAANIDDPLLAIQGRGRPRTLDIDFDMDMEVQYMETQKIRLQEKQAAAVVTDIENQIVQLQKRLLEAKEEQLYAAAKAEEASASFAMQVMEKGQGPWKDMFHQLQAYETVHGTVNIIRGQTPEMKALRRWVLRQRERYHMKDEQKSKLPWYCARNLESIGFLWRYSDGTWMKFYNELQDYKKEYGDCAVPRGFKPNPKLSQWVKRMRHEGNRFKENPNSVSMTEHQYKMLNDIGFIWENLSRSWNERFEDLKRFKAEHGHCRIPKVYPANPKLVSWAQNQRAHHRAFLLGKKTFMDAARKAQLEEVGFEWETGATPGRPPSSTTDKKKRASRKKKEEIREEELQEEDAESEEEQEEEDNTSSAAVIAEDGDDDEEEQHTLLGSDQQQQQQQTIVPQPFAAPPVQVFQNHAFAYPNHAYANPYHQQQQPNRGGPAAGAGGHNYYTTI